MDIVFNFLAYLIIAIAAVSGMILIPLLIPLSAESENNPDHIYSIFNEESGYKGRKIFSAVGFLFPLIIVSQASMEIMAVIMMLVVGIILSLYHLSVYKNYPVLNDQMKIVLFIGVILLTAMALVTRQNYMSELLFFIVLMLSGVAWGGYSVYRRSKLICITRLLNE